MIDFGGDPDFELDKKQFSLLTDKYDIGRFTKLLTITTRLSNPTARTTCLASKEVSSRRTSRQINGSNSAREDTRAIHTKVKIN